MTRSRAAPPDVRGIGAAGGTTSRRRARTRLPALTASGLVDESVRKVYNQFVRRRSVSCRSIRRLEC
jgi:hypothetical protein